MRILAIETSCDETAIAILEATGGLENPSFNILGNTLVSQIDIHKEYGGVYPMLAKREHLKNLPIVLEKTLAQAKINLDKPDIDYITVTYGPGLAPALWTGVDFAEALGKKWNIPVLATNHMEGHIYSVLFCPTPGVGQKKQIQFPAIALLVSGGHTELVLMKDFGSYEILGKTRDDAVGEAFDKVARLLNLEYPGGPKISKLADAHRQKGYQSSFTFPRPMINSGDLDFSYSGLKTSILYKTKELGEINDSTREEIAHAFEDAAVEVLIEKTKKALETHSSKTLIVAGGVSMNNYLQNELHTLIEQFPETTLLLPEPSLTTDNAIMIGIAAYINILKGKTETEGKIKANGNVSL